MKVNGYFSAVPSNFALKVERVPSKARVLVAQKDFQAGDEVLMVRSCP